MSDVKLDLQPQVVQDGWAIFFLRVIEIEAKLSENYNSRTARAILNTPDSAPLRVAVALFPGNGTQPENTISLQAVSDMAQQGLMTLEDAVRASVKANEKEDSGW